MDHQHEDRPRSFVGLLAAAEDLGCAPETLRKRIRSGELTIWSDPLDRRQKLIDTTDLDRLRMPHRRSWHPEAA